MKKRSRAGAMALFASVLTIFCLSLSSALAQSGMLQGKVTDPTGAQIPGAEVTVTNAAGLQKSATSDALGLFTISPLAPGVYQINASAKGFREAGSRSVTLAGGQSASVNLELPLASVSETIQVYGAAGELDPFQSKSVTVGPLGDVSELDLPYSVNTIPGNVIESQHVTTLADLVKYIPSAQFEQRFGMNVGRLMTRGFQSSVFQNVLVDGMYISSTTQFPLQAYERLEVMNGLGGGLYGPANPSGTFNFILKRPSDERVETIGADYDNMGVASFRADLGGALGPKKFFGYRMNFLVGNGTSWTSISRIKQDVESGAFDFHLTPRTLLEANYIHSQYDQYGLPGSFSYASTVQLPSAPDPSKPGLGQPYAGLHVSTEIYLLRLKHSFRQNLRLMAAVADQQAPRDMFTVSNTITTNAGAYTARLSPSYNKGTVRSAVLYLNGELKSGPVAHKLILGARAYSNLGYGSTTAGAPSSSVTNLLFAGTPTLDNPLISTSLPVLKRQTGTYKSGNSGQETLIFGDTAIWGKWLASFTGSYNWLYSRSYDATGQLVTPREKGVYYQNGFTPTASLSYKPKDNMTAYFAYSTSIIAGEQNTTTGTLNYLAYLAPERSHQYEAGFKAQLGQYESTLALFRMDRPIAYVQNNIFAIQGEQVNRGLEWNVRGKVTRDLNLLSGLTWLDPRMHQTQDPNFEGKQYPGAPRIMANILADYQLAAFRPLREAAVSGNYHLMGKRASNEANTYWIDSVSTLDFGARYSHTFGPTLASARFGVNNVTNKSYWASIMPGSQGNTTATSDTANVGAPRTYNFSLLLTFH